MLSVPQERKKIVRVVGVLLLVVALPLAIFGISQVQDIRQRAAFPVQTVGYGSGPYGGNSTYGTSAINPTVAVATSPTFTPIPSPTSVQQPTDTLTPALPTATLPPLPSPTSVLAEDLPSSTKLDVVLQLNGLGSFGDSVNPAGGGNSNPLHKQRVATVQVYNAQNVLVRTRQGPVTFASGSGDFRGTIDLGSTTASGSYLLRFSTSSYLSKIVPGIVNIVAGQTRVIAPLRLKGGDIDRNGTINIADYNIMIGCYSDLSQAVNCDASRKEAADITDDGAVNQFDYNMFIREVSVVEGD